MKYLSLALVILLTACSHNPKPMGKPLPTLSYQHLQPMTILGGSVRLQQSFRPNAMHETTRKQFPYEPAQILMTYATQRFVHNGAGQGLNDKLVFDIQEASLSKVSDQDNLVGFLSGRAEDMYKLKILIHMIPIRADGQRAAPFKISYKRQLGIPQNTTLAQREFRQFEMIEKAIVAIDQRLITMVNTQMTPEYF